MTANAPERPQADEEHDQDQPPTTAEALADKAAKLGAEIDKHLERLRRQ
ncbi:hypothetical protein [Streptomyces violascens]|uniref:Nucleotide exchange factor GrpE n=1 Tax=Streptomyces violascens TaxID=67381 RepID=A0ABQ3QQV9_9ACTN|nr:hypothetical protein [Streptomyces violascens]GGU49260.1 hypothetical protein GCM10010289_82300 [Streptomyces violascens]GHI39656.1 hypothetical protein Sviol_40640 [Streptomyces violascens]